MIHLSVPNWKKLQQYNDGRPIHWIKLYLNLLEDYMFSTLPEPSQWHLVRIWILAAKTRNRIPCDAKWIQQRIGSETEPDIQALMDAGFLEMYDENGGSVEGSYESVRDRTVTVRCREHRGEERRGEKRREEKTICAPDGAPASDAPPSKSNPYTGSFVPFWEAYPEKKGKRAAFKAYQRALKRATHDEIMAGLERYKRSKPPDRGWKFAEGWLNADRWTDEYTASDDRPRGGHQPSALSTAEELEKDWL